MKRCRFCKCLLTGTEENEGVCYDCSTLTCELCGQEIDLGINVVEDFIVGTNLICDDCFEEVFDEEAED